MAERSEKELRIEQGLDELVKNFPQYIKIDFISKGEMESLSHKGRNTDAVREGNRVRVILCEFSNEKDLGLWADATVKALELVGEIEKEVSWQRTNPNFFLAMKAKFG